MLIEVELVRKRFSIYGFFNVVTLVTVCLLMLLGSKYLLFRSGNYFSLALLVSLFVVLIGLTAVNPSHRNYMKKVSTLNAFFSNVGLEKVKSYYRYRRIIVSYLVIIYCLFPLNVDVQNTKYFFSIFLLLSIFMLVNTISSKYFSKRTSESVHASIRIFYGVLLALYSRHMLPVNIEGLVSQTNLILLVGMSCVIAILNVVVLSNKRKRA